MNRIEDALGGAMEILRGLSPGDLSVEHKAGAGPVCEADRRVNDFLCRTLPGAGDGWLSEETRDDHGRLSKRRVWVVDPIDGTHEFLDGIPEWAISIGLVEDGHAVAGGIANPATGEVFLGSMETGVIYNGKAARVTGRETIDGALVLASRSEFDRGEWERCRSRPFTVKPVGSVAYKLALVAAGLADATWTLVPKHEWDVAAGVALVLAAGGQVQTLDGARPRFNRSPPRFTGLAACSPALGGAVREEMVVRG
jgi:myo-inositol-1(or 4)-monophosphatase